MRAHALFIGVALVVASSTGVLTEERPTQKPAQQQPALPVSLDQALYLIRSTLLTLNDANRSGNYSVLRELAAPEFQAKNSAADLALIFTDLRRRNFDLYGAALLAPQLTAVPAIDSDRRLHLVGNFETRPLLIHFDLIFQVVGGQWRLFGISIATPAAPQAPQAAQLPQAKMQSPDKPAGPSIIEQRYVFPK